MRAIDLYSGIGGWTLGLKSSGLEIVRSYEWWDRANETLMANHPECQAVCADIRALPLDAFPRDVDIVVGSPPCTQFSFSNRGGGGDIEDGLQDIRKFLQVVEWVRPKWWAMENVPRVAGILDRELGFGGRLADYRNLVSTITVVDMSEFGLPQARRRMIAGTFPVDLLDSYRGSTPARTLGEVISALASDEQVVDPVWGHTYRRSEVTEHEYEPVLDDEEERMNREAKTFHPIYNLMRFPDALDRPSRTVTALCTRVSRESIVVPHGDRVRRLTVRERGCLQGFPVAYQFFGRSYSEKSKMIGNAIPPQFTFFIAQAMLGTAPGEVELKRLQSQRHPLPEIVPPPRPPIEPRRSYRSSRVFRAALPNLRFGSGVRFELANSCLGSETGWSVRFFYGTSKDIRVVEPGVELVKRLTDLLPDGLPVVVDELRRTVCSGFEDLDSKLLQEVWSHRSSTGLHPFEVVDLLGEAVDKVRGLLAGHAGWEPGCLLQRVLGSGRWSAKLDRNAVWIVGGLLVGGWFNEVTGVDTLN